MKNIILLLILTLASLNSCKEKCQADYLFEIPMTIHSPDTIAIGDTLWLESEIPHQILDLNSNTLVDVGEFDYLVELNMGIPDSVAIGEGKGHKDFEIIPDRGQNYPLVLIGATYEQLKYENTNDKQGLRIGFVAKKSERYSFSFTSFYHELTNVSKDFFDKQVSFDDSDKCIEYLNIRFKMNDGTYENNNFYLFEDAGALSINNYQKEFYRNTGAFSFVVRE